MATIAFLHAHPDDECILTGGTIAQLAGRGHQVLLVFATDGEAGELPDGVDRAELAAIRRTEAAASAEILGAEAALYLGYADSGVRGNSAPHSNTFAGTPVRDAAGRLAALLRDARADALVGYDHHGNYGHPDHVQVHQVARRAAVLVGISDLYQATMNRDHVRAHLPVLAAGGVLPVELDPDGAGVDGRGTGQPGSSISETVDVAEWIEEKRAALTAHRSQAGYSGYYLGLSRRSFHRTFSQEWFIHDPVVSGSVRSIASLLREPPGQGDDPRYQGIM